MSDEDKINILRIRYLKNRFLNGMDQGCYRLCATSLRSTIYPGWSCTFATVINLRILKLHQIWLERNLIWSLTTEWLLSPYLFCKPSFRLLWMKPSRCTWPSHSSLGHGINQTFIAGNSLQISACHVYQSVWQMITPSPEQQPYLGGWACPGFLDELVLELCGQESLVRLSTPGCHRVTDWGEILSESIPPLLLPPQLLERFFYQPWPTLEVHEVTISLCKVCQLFIFRLLYVGAFRIVWMA